VAGKIAAVGGAAALGLVAGKIAAGVLGVNPQKQVMRDQDLPATSASVVASEVKATLDDLDRTADDLVIWVPGTMRGRIPGAFSDGVKQAFQGRDVSLVKLPTHPDYQIVQGVADSAESVRQIVRELDATRKPGQRILLAGESQGAWSLGIALQDPDVRDAVDRSVVWGNPGLQPHQFDGAGDGRMLELSDELDVVGRPVYGNPTLLTDALSGFMDGDVSQAWRLPAIAVNNGHSTTLLLRTAGRLLTPGGYDRDPHNHREFMGAAARFLADAPAPGTVLDERA
jgi:hypothetical protein